MEKDMNKATFENLLEYAHRIKCCLPVDKLPRDPKVQQAYEEHKRKYDLHEHIMNRYLGDKDYVLIPNKFPLDVATHISHYVLWIKDASVTLNVAEFLNEQFNGNRFVYYENPEDWKSIPSIKHYHIFVERSLEQ
jgi:hypothetical protein